MPTLEIIREEPKTRLVTMGQASRVIEAPAPPVITNIERTAEGITIEFSSTERITAEPLEPRKPSRGRPKKTANEDRDTVGEDKDNG